VYAATARIYAPGERATGLGFTTFAVTAVLGAAAITLVPLARRGRPAGRAGAVGVEAAARS